MTANASWSVAPVSTVNISSSMSSSTENASWDLAGPGLARTVPRSTENIFLKRFGLQKGGDGGAGLDEASLLQGRGDGVGEAMDGNAHNRFDVKSMLRDKKGGELPLLMPIRKTSIGKPQQQQMMLSSVSTSALSHATLYNSQDCSGSGGIGGGGGTKLREETLRSLGISRPSSRLQPGRPLRSALRKQNNGGMSRALTMASIREVEVCLPNSKTIKRNTSINFNEEVKVRKIPSSSSFAEYKNELWFQDAEMKSMRRKAKSIANMAEINGASDETFVRQTGDTLRGLERYMDTRAHGRTRRNKLELWDAVMDEQEAMRYYGNDYDDEKIAGLCRSISVDSLRAARRRAQGDALEVQHFLLPTTSAGDQA